MQKRTKFSIIFIILLFILIIVAFIFAHKLTRDFQQMWNTQGTLEHAKVKDVVVTETKDGIKDWEMYAATAEYDNDRVIATLTDIIGNYYKNNEVIMSFTAPKGTYDSGQKKIALLDSVKVVGKDDITLTANKIYWITTENKIHAEGNVTINKGNEVIALSDKASVTTDFKFIEIIDNAEVRVYKRK